MATDIDYDLLDPGIRELVRELRAMGYQTTDSGDGVTKGDAGERYPHVAITFPPSEPPNEVVAEAHRAAVVAGTRTERPWAAHVSTTVRPFDSETVPEDPWLVYLVDAKLYWEDCERYAASLAGPAAPPSAVAATTTVVE